MKPFSQTYYANRFTKLMAKSDAIRMDEKEVLKFGEENLIKWAEERRWVAYILKVKSPSGNLTTISLAIIARSWSDVLAIVTNAIQELTNSKASNLGMEKVRINVLEQYKEHHKELVQKCLTILEQDEQQQTSKQTA